MYFQSFPEILYDFEINGKRQIILVKDITNNIRFKKEILESVTLYDEYDIVDGETPEMISEKFYGTPEYHWIIMLANQRYDYISDFPLQQPELDKYVTQKYGAGNEYAVHHYVDSKGRIVNSTEPGSTSVSNYQYEDVVNESKRRIKIIAPQLINKILDQFREMFK